MMHSLNRQGGWAALGCEDGRHPERRANGEACTAMARNVGGKLEECMGDPGSSKRPRCLVTQTPTCPCAILIIDSLLRVGTAACRLRPPMAEHRHWAILAT